MTMMSGPMQPSVDAINTHVLGAIPVSKSSSFSMWELFWNADLIIQLVMVGLLIASIWSWAIIFHKIVKLRRLNNQADQFEESFWSGGALDDLYNRLQKLTLDPMGSIFCAAMKEWHRSFSKGFTKTGPTKALSARGTVEQRIERVMELTLNREMDSIESHMGFLASLGSNAVIIGLFGTVLGIMNSFEPIASQQNATLATVAPGIAEALLATAIGLVAAIPAAIAYNKLTTDINRYANRLDGFVNEFGSIISRQLEEHL